MMNKLKAIAMTVCAVSALQVRAAGNAIALHAAAEKGEVAKVKELLKGGIAVDSLVGGMTALMPAIAKGHEEVVRTLLAHGADANAGAIELHTTPLHAAALWRRADIILPLLAYGADVGVINNEGETPLTLCSSDENFVSRFEHFIQEHGHAVRIASALLTVFPVADLVYGVLLPYVLEQAWPSAELQAAAQTRAKMASRQAEQRRAPDRQDSVGPAAKRRRKG